MVDIIRPNFGTVWAASGEKLSPTEIKIQGGWIQEMMPYQYQNFLQNRVDNAITYLLQKGVPEWDASQEYTANKSVVTYSGQLYMALTTNTNVLPTVAASWKRLTTTLGANGAIPVAFGGTGATNASDARTNLGLGTAATLDANTLVIKSVTGNAPAADKLTTARTITLTGGAAGSVSFDGSSDQNLNVTGLNASSLNSGTVPTTVLGNTVLKTSGTGSAQFPAGTTAERDSAPLDGWTRWNRTTKSLESWNGTAWVSSFAVDLSALVGIGPTQVPSNSMLGSAAYLSRDTFVERTLNYDTLRAYTGSASTIQVTAVGIAGFFGVVPTGADDGGITIVGTDGRIWKRAFGGAISVEWFGASPSKTDNTVEFQRAINSIGYQDPFAQNSTGTQIQLKPGQLYKVLGKLLIPSFVNIDLNGSTIEGNPAGTLFETGYWSGGAVVSNMLDPIDTRFVVCSSIRNGQISNAGGAFNLLNFCEDSSLTRLRLFGCNQAIKARRCFYGKFEDIHSRSPLDPSTTPCYNIDDSIGAITLNSMFAVGYDLGWLISGAKKDNVVGINCGTEACPTGLRVTGKTDSMQIRGWYFENNYNAIDFDTNSNHENVVVDGCWFYSVTNAVQGETILSGEITQHNVFNGAKVNLPSNFAPRTKIGIAATSSANTGTGTLPVNYVLGDSCDVDYLQHVYNSTSGEVSVKGHVYSGPVPHAYSGTSGKLILGSIPFCTCTLSGDTLTIDTKIRYQFTEMIGINIVVNTTGSPLLYAGIAVLDSVVKLAGDGGVAAGTSNNGGYYRITLSGLVNATEFAGIVRIL